MAGEDELFYCLDKAQAKVLGPFTATEIQQGLSSGLLTEDYPTTREGAESWCLLKDLTLTLQSGSAVDALFMRQKISRGIFASLISKFKKK